MFFCEIYETFEETFLYKTPLVASVFTKDSIWSWLIDGMT